MCVRAWVSVCVEMGGDILHDIHSDLSQAHTNAKNKSVLTIACIALLLYVPEYIRY